VPLVIRIVALLIPPLWTVQTPLAVMVTFSPDEAVAATFADIDEWARVCRFADCSHEVEPGCAVMAAAARHLDPARLTTLVVGDEAAFGQDLAQLNLGAPAIVSADSI
jgi:hypothetical protein